MTIMNEEIALYQSGAQSSAPWATIKVGDYLKWVKTGVVPTTIKSFGEPWRRQKGYAVMQTSAETIRKIRKGIPSREKEVLKNQCLTPVTFGHCNPMGKETGVLITRVVGKKNDSGTRFANFDIDGFDTVELAKEKRDLLFLNIPSVIAAGLSASGKGVWLVIALSRPTADKDDYANVWWKLAADLKEQGVDIGQSTGAGATDRAPSNMVSLRYYSHDPDLRMRSEADIKLYEIPPPEDVPSIEESKLRAGILNAMPAKAQRSPRQQKKMTNGKTGETTGNAKTSKMTKTRIPPVPIYSKRVNWVADADDGGVDNHHDRARNAIWKDVLDNQIPDDNRIDAYVSAIGREDRPEVERLVNGAVEKIHNRRKAKARGESETPSTLFPDPATMPIAECEWDLGNNADKVLSTDKVLYVPEQRIWRVWDDNAWRDGTMEMVCWMGCVGKHTYGSYDDKRVFKHQPSTGGRNSTANASLKFLHSNSRIKNATCWDDNRRLLGLPNGDCLEITSKGAIVRRQLPSDFITQSLPFAPAKDWRGGQFEEFLNRVVPDKEIQQYLQRHLGYGLVCDGSEPFFLWLRGQGRSGKSTLIRYIQSCVPQHFTTVQRDTLLLKMATRHLTAEAKLANKRFAYWAEARGDGNIDAEKIKGFTGGDEQTSHFMRQDMFDWTPRFLLIIVSNGDLQLASPDDAFYERVRLVDCWTTIPADERKTSIWRQARSGDPQCLRWLADGAADYVSAVTEGDGSGLLPETTKMLNDRLEWQYDADTVGKFVQKKCKIITPPKSCSDVMSINELYLKYTLWLERQNNADETDKEAVSKTEFSRRLKQLPSVTYKQRRFGEILHRGFNLSLKD